MSEPHHGDGKNWNTESYQYLVEQATDITIVVSGDGTLRYVSDAAERILGYASDDLLQKDCGTFVHPEDRTEFMEAVTAAEKAVTDTHRLEVRLLDSDGSDQWVEAIVQRPPDDTLEGVLVTARPIRDRTDRADSLATTKERMELALEGANLGIWDWNMETGAVERDELLTEMLGYTPAEMGDHLDDWERLVHPDGEKRHNRALSGHVENRTPYYQCEYRLNTASGEWKWVRTIGKVVDRDEDGTPVRAVGIHQDIDDRKRAEMALEEERDLFREGPAIVFKWQNQEGWPIDYVSKNVEEILGYTPTELQSDNRQFADLVHKDDLERLEREVAEQIDAGQTQLSPEPYRVLTAKGDVRWVIEYTRILQESDGDNYLLGYLVDITERKLRKKKYRNLFEDTRDALMVFDREGYLDCNERTLDLFGLESVSEFLTYTPWELAPPNQPDGRDSKAVAHEHIERAFEEGEAFFEFTHQRADGSSFPSEVKLSRFEYEGESVLHALIRDITDRKKRERELQEREEKYRNLFEDTRDALMLLDRDGFFDCNERTLELFQADSVEKFVEFGPWELSPETQPDGTDSKRAAQAYIERAFEEGEAFFEWTHQRRDGTEFPAEVKLSKFQGDGKPALHALVRDITERKEHEQELQELNTWFQFALEETDTGVWEWDLGTDELVWDEASEHLLGYDSGMVPTFDALLERIHDSDVPGLRDEIHTALQSENDLQTDVRLETPEGNWKWVQVQGSVQYDDSGEPQRMVGIQTDITERKQREQEIRWERELNRRMQKVLAESGTRSVLEDRITEQLHQHGYAIAWVGEQVGDEVVPRRIGGGGRYVENIDRSIDSADPEAEPSVLAARSGEPQYHQHLQNRSSGSWTETARKYNYRSCAAIPIVHRDVSYGIVALYHEQPDRFGESEQEFLTELADTIGFAIHSLETQDALASNRTLDATIELAEGHYLVDVIREEACLDCETFAVRGTVPMGEDAVMQYVEFSAESPAAVQDAFEASPAVRETKIVIDDDPMRLQVTVTDPVPEAFLASRGVMVNSTRIDAETASIAIELRRDADISTTVDALSDKFGQSSVRAISERTQGSQKRMESGRVRANLTDKQATALKTAYHNGYFDQPRRATASAIADSLGVSHSTFLQHLHRAEEKVFGAKFENMGQ